MIVINLQDVVHQYGTRRVLDGVAWEIQTGQKIGLVGANGAGKSTLLRIIAGDIQPDDGRIYRWSGLKVGYLAQTPALDAQATVMQEAMGADPAMEAMERALRRLEARMAEPQVAMDEKALSRTMRAYDRAMEEFSQAGGYEYESRVRAALQQVGLDHALDQPICELSGGQRKLVGMAKLLAADLNCLLLDEPDNHLDLDHKAMLEEVIRRYEGTVILVSHDRYLLDQTVSLIADVEDGRVTVYHGNYTAFAVEKELRLLKQQQAYQAQQKQIKHLEASIARFEMWARVHENARAAVQARSRKKMLERMDKVEQPILERRRMGLDLGGWRGSKKVLEITDLDKVFETEDGEGNIVLAGLDLLIWHGERVGLLGPNGAGKTVLMRTVLGQIEADGGRVVMGPSVRVGHYAQEHETLNMENTLIQEIRETKSMYENQAVGYLGGYLFDYDMARQKVGQLSGGERSRLQLAKLVLSDCNFLLLDEPTNNLDLPSCEVLEKAIESFAGTVLVISHDRYFLDRIVDRVVELDDGALTEYAGDYTYYREEKAKRKARPVR